MSTIVNKTKKNLILLIFLFAISSIAFSQGNTPCTAVAITANASCVNTAGTTVGQTYQNNANNGGTPTCASPGAPDVWYSFTPTTTATYTITTSAGTIIDGGLAVYSGGACNTLASLACNDDGGPNSPMSQIVIALTSGTTYYLRIWEYSSGTGTFNICVVQGAPPPAAPANDDPTGATPITPAASCSYTNFTTAGATASSCGTIPAPGCASYAGNDIWFSVLVPASGGFILDSQTGVITDGGLAVYSGIPCGAMNLLYCDDDSSPNGAMPSVTVSATAGTTVYVRFWEYGNDNNGTFGICAKTYTPPAPPSNNDPCSATAVTVNPNLICTTQSNGTVVGATPSTVAIGACFGNPDDDVWYSFIATSTMHYVSLNNIAGSVTDMYHSVHAGPCGSIGAALVCSDANNSTVSGLIIGNTYFIRVYTYTSGSQTTTFSVCVTSPPPPPSNDDPCGATAAAVNSAPGTCTVQTAGTISGATASGVALGACFGTADDDVWYSFVANATSMNININNITGSTTNLYHSVYSGACNALGAAIICSDPNSSTITGLTIGNTYRIRIYSYTSTTGQSTSFSLCINPTPPPPTNVTCAQMQPICSGSPIVFQAQSSGGSAAPGPNYGCLSTTPNPTWFYLEILAPGTMAVDLTAGSDVDFALWGPYASLAVAQANCNSYPAPLDCSYSGSAVEQMNIPVAVTGQVYAVLVTNYASIIQSITLNQASGATANTNCSILLPAGLLYFNATPDEDIVNINWATESEQNNHFFEIEKSIDGSKWVAVDRKDGMGNTQIRTNYNSVDNQPYQGLSYYRLKQVNFDETFKYTNIVSVDLSKGKEQITNVHPNPTNDNIEFEVITKSKNTILIEVINNTGNVVSTQQNIIEEGNNPVKLNLEKFESGIYLLKVSFESSGKSLVQKILKK